MKDSDTVAGRAYLREVSRPSSASVGCGRAMRARRHTSRNSQIHSVVLLIMNLPSNPCHQREHPVPLVDPDGAYHSETNKSSRRRTHSCGSQELP